MQAVNLSRAQAAVVRVFVVAAPGASYTESSQRQGSGAIIERSCVLTCAHVVGGLSEGDVIWVEMDSPKVAVKASLMGVDTASDVALLRCDLPFHEGIRLRMSGGEPTPGQKVYAVGFPAGLGKVVTSGIVSAKGCSGFGLSPVEDFIITDAVIGPGNSGGPLVDSEGRMVGLVSGVLDREGVNRPLGLAVSSPLVASVIRQVQSGQSVHRGYLGARVGYQMAPLDSAEGISVRVRIEEVLPGSPAAEAGLEAGDVVTAAGKQAVENINHLLATCRNACPGDKVAITVHRDGRSMSRTVVLGDMSAPKNAGSVCDFCPHCGCSTF